jgi:predicted nucleic acid-binding protein
MLDLNSLDDLTVPFVLDASVVINLTSSGFASEIINSLPNDILILKTVYDELSRGRSKGRPHADLLDELILGGEITVANLPEEAENCFEDLIVGADSSTLDDGEAATIAYSVNTSSVAIIDERKATRICNERFPNLRIGSTIDIFSHDKVSTRLGSQNLSDALFCSLKKARMRVMNHYQQWVIDIVGMERVATCHSLPRALLEKTNHSSL